MLYVRETYVAVVNKHNVILEGNIRGSSKKHNVILEGNIRGSSK